MLIEFGVDLHARPLRGQRATISQRAADMSAIDWSLWGTEITKHLSSEDFLTQIHNSSLFIYGRHASVTLHDLLQCAAGCDRQPLGKEMQLYFTIEQLSSENLIKSTCSVGLLLGNPMA